MSSRKAESSHFCYLKFKNFQCIAHVYSPSENLQQSLDIHQETIKSHKRYIFLIIIILWVIHNRDGWSCIISRKKAQVKKRKLFYIETRLIISLFFSLSFNSTKGSCGKAANIRNRRSSHPKRFCKISCFVVTYVLLKFFEKPKILF